MKTLLALLFLAFAGICFAADAPAPRIVAVTGCAYPQAHIISVDAPNGVVVFAWLKANGIQADSGNSIAKFTPVAPVAPVPPATAPTYPAPTDATLAAAIAATK